MEMKGSRAAFRRAISTDALAICISDSTPSCIRAPPEAETMMSGTRRSTERRVSRAIFSPTTDPLEPLRVVLKVEGIGRTEAGVEFVPGALVDQQVDVVLGGDAAMVPTVGADIEAADEAVLDVDMAAGLALLPGVGRDLELDSFRRARFPLFLEPGHARHRGGVEGDNL